ncbi:MAG: murein L,D-transpeptidase [Alphaproteobacteria bacterium]|nr:murein L,D-transpeptidase [Alphaproteobacteria bacterium]MBU1549008.1 murein L,D-transpeptidase [Alphaproteobacteria bacterium]MBU2334856.1 murein L,D-transpeptidase [Alphaproteobacteria bacterium]MBU2386461.1 murein L,D-transpeptidase [Alphaproteobacteria bacterium]|tara:strand:+ start:333 stop:1625 length:1293 start_codon:yes stop_codon:yes gene_type:complete
MSIRLRNIALALFFATALAGCNDTLDSVDLSHVKNKVEQPLPSRIVTEMQKKNMPRNSPIMMRIFKEEGALEIWKAKADGRFDVIASYSICAWSGKLGPKVKEGDRQAPEGFYNLTPAHLNPNSNYYLAINTGFPNRFDQAQGRTGSNLMIHGACSSSGCYSMTDAQVLEIYAFARDAFKGGQTAVQLQAFPFRMTAENMARHRDSEHLDFWKMLKVGYDNFEVTKRPPEVNICEKKYVFNQQVEGTISSAAAACPPMSTPPALNVALASYQKTYEVAYDKAMKKLDGMVWYEPTEAERKAVVAAKRKGRDLAYAPTGTSLEAGKLLKRQEFEALMAKRSGPQSTPATPMLASTSTSTSSRPATAAERMKQDRLPQTATTWEQAPAETAAADSSSSTTTVPIPAPNPLAYAAPPVSTAEKKPLWKFWASE